MKSCTIIVSHFNSEPFLRACIRQIRKYANHDIRQEIIICDQSEWSTYHRVYSEYSWSSDVRVVRTESLYSGFGIDWSLRNEPINTDYICQLHCDAFGISDKWLLLPITLIEEYGLSFVGQLQFVSDGTQSIYPPNPIFAMAQCFNVARTDTYKTLSLEAGFTRFHNRPQSGLSFENNDWSLWAADDYDHKGSDDDVVAFSWQDRVRNDNKLGLAITGFCQPHWGRIIEDIVFHFGSCRESIGTGNAMGDNYANYTNRINENYDDALIDEMVNIAKQNKPPSDQILTRNYWDGTLKQSFPSSEEINKRIYELKNM